MLALRQSVFGKVRRRSDRDPAACPVSDGRHLRVTNRHTVECLQITRLTNILGYKKAIAGGLLFFPEVRNLCPS